MIDHWTTDGLKLTDEQVLARLRRILDDESPLIVEHRHYRGARAPSRFVFDDYATERYLASDARAGAFYVWRFDECCRDDNPVANGKIPDGEGRVPTGGPTDGLILGLTHRCGADQREEHA